MSTYRHPEDDSDIYDCPFEFQYAFHSGEECHHPKEYTYILNVLKDIWQPYDKIKKAVIESLTNS